MPTWAVVGIAVVAVVIAGLVAWRLLQGVTSWGGDRSDGLKAGGQVISRTNAYRGSSRPEDARLDGQPPTVVPKDDVIGPGA